MRSSSIDPQEVQRQVVLALVLEPLAEKAGCTTRNRDINEELRLVDLQGAAVNVGRYFHELARRVQRSKGQPRVFFDLCFRALTDSAKNLKNKKFVNLGLLELLFPMVVAKLTARGGETAVWRNYIRVLKQSSPADVSYKELALATAWNSSRKLNKRQYPTQLGGNTLHECYRRHARKGRELNFAAHEAWCRQILQGLPVAQRMYRVAKRNMRAGLIGALEEAYRHGLRAFAKPGVIADYTAVIAYLMLSDHNAASNLI